jgi:hypothetical protein
MVMIARFYLGMCACVVFFLLFLHTVIHHTHFGLIQGLRRKPMTRRNSKEEDDAYMYGTSWGFFFTLFKRCVL